MDKDWGTEIESEVVPESSVTRQTWVLSIRCIEEARDEVLRRALAMHREIIKWHAVSNPEWPGDSRFWLGNLLSNWLVQCSTENSVVNQSINRHLACFHDKCTDKIFWDAASKSIINKSISLQPISECDESINELIDQITVDRWPVPQGHRPVRATGAAMAVAVTLLEVR